MSEADSGQAHPPDEIDLWLGRVQLPQYAANFRANNITLEILPTLDDADLKACGVESLGHRKILLSKIREQFSGAASAAVPTPAERSPEPASPAKPALPAVKRSVVPPPIALSVPRIKPVPDEPPAHVAAPIPLSAAAPMVSAAAPTVSAAAAKEPVAPRRWPWKRFGGGFLFISILVHLCFLGGATYLVVQRIQAKRKLTFTAGPPAPPSQPVEHKVQLQKEETMSAAQMVQRITTTGLGKINLPDMPQMPTQAEDVTPMKMAGEGTMGGGAPMMAGGGGPGGFGIGLVMPSIMADRCSAESRRKAIVENGGDPRTDTAVINALRWLQQKQNPNGTWGTGYIGAMTGLSLLSYLGHCERPNTGEFGPTVKNAIDAIINAGADGNLYFKLGGNGAVYTHAICTYALGEAYILTKDERIIPVFRQAIGLIVAGQRPDGGWCYNFAQPPADTSDTSVSCWMIQALKTAHYSGLNIAGVDAALDKAMGDLLRVHGPNGIFGYRAPGQGGELTGAATFCLLTWHHAQSKAVGEGLRVLQDGPIVKRGKRPPPPIYKFKDPAANLYAWYYDTQACFQAGGDSWDWWGHNVEPEIINNQTADGSWPPDGTTGEAIWVFLKGGDSSPEGQVYRTAMCTLMLEVYFRYTSNSRVEGAIQMDNSSL